MSLLERIREAVDVVSAGAPPEGSLREQAEAHLGEEVDDECALVIVRMGKTVSQMVFEDCLDKGIPPLTAINEARAAVLIAGMAIGKRLGAKEGEEFGRITAQLGKTE